MEEQYISFPTAAIYWRTGLMPEATVSDPVHILVSDASLRNKGTKYICHVMPKNLPENSFIKINSDKFVACPELCFLQAANYLKLHQLVLLGNNLCAKYCLDELSQFGQQGITPVASKASINKYLNGCNNINGVKKARLGNKYIIDNSNSPRESEIATLINLPALFGGYALKCPKLNKEIVLSAAGETILGKKTCIVDVVWENEKVALEYDSTAVHLSLDQFNYDKKRASALNMSGYKVVSVTAEQLKSFRSTENLFEALRQELGMKKETEKFIRYTDIRWQVINDIILNNNQII